MKAIISKEAGQDLVKLGLYQVAGGIYGGLNLLWEIYKTPLLDGPTVVICIFSFLLFAFSVVCGSLCLRTSEKALKYSLVNQLLQVISFTVIGVSFMYVAGLYGTIGFVDEGEMKLQFGAGISRIQLQFGGNGDALSIDVNLIALGVTYWITTIMEIVKEETELRNSTTILEP
jgi:hypothetical protein